MNVWVGDKKRYDIPNTEIRLRDLGTIRRDKVKKLISLLKENVSETVY